jgi:hypothetical protein
LELAIGELLMQVITFLLLLAGLVLSTHGQIADLQLDSHIFGIDTRQSNPEMIFLVLLIDLRFDRRRLREHVLALMCARSQPSQEMMEAVIKIASEVG